MRITSRNTVLVVGFCAASFFVFSIIARGKADQKKLAEIDGVVITEREVDHALGRSLVELRRQIYNLQRQKLQELIDEKLLNEEAKRRGISIPTLVDQEVNTKVVPVTDKDILALYNANKERIPVELDKVQDKIKEFLWDQRVRTQRQELLKTLRAKARVVTYLKPPEIHRVEVSVNGAPFKGSENAGVTLVKFEDFQCPFCKQVQPTMKELLKRYDGKLRVVHKDLPLDAIHPQARQAAEAARCAGEQGKFWEYHDMLYTNSPKSAVVELKSYAKEVGLNTTLFDQCLASAKYRSAVEKDLNQGTQLGLTGTPTFFINGRELAGNQPLEAFAAIIEEELSRAK